MSINFFLAIGKRDSLNGNSRSVSQINEAWLGKS
jgi:hypothetical protein